MRKEIFAPPGFKATNLRVDTRFDNGVRVFINGHEISGGWEYRNNCPTDVDATFTASDEFLNEGTNLLAVWGRNLLGTTYLDVEVVADLTPIAILPITQTLSKGECPFCGNAERQNYIGDPINSYSGNFNQAFL